MDAGDPRGRVPTGSMSFMHPHKRADHDGYGEGRRERSLCHEDAIRGTSSKMRSRQTGHTLSPSFLAVRVHASHTTWLHGVSCRERSGPKHAEHWLPPTFAASRAFDAAEIRDDSTDDPDAPPPQGVLTAVLVATSSSARVRAHGKKDAGS